MQPNIIVYLTDDAGGGGHRRVAFARVPTARALALSARALGAGGAAALRWTPLLADLAVGALGGQAPDGRCADALLKVQLLPQRLCAECPLRAWAPDFAPGPPSAGGVPPQLAAASEKGLRLFVYRALDLPLDKSNFAPSAPELRVRFLDQTRALKGTGASPEWCGRAAAARPPRPRRRRRARCVKRVAGAAPQPTSRGSRATRARSATG